MNNSVIFCGKPIGPEEFLNRMVETLGIIVDRRPKGRLRKIENQTIGKDRMCSPILIKKIEEEEEK